MTIRDNNSNNNKSFASAAPTTTETDAVAFNVNADDDVFNEDTNIPFAHASSLSTTTTTAANNSGLYGQLNNNNNAGATTTTTHAAQRTPIAYSTGKPPQPRSSSVAVATGAPTPTPTPIYATHTTRYNNSSECCTRWNTCGGITCIVLSCFFIGCCLPIFLSIIMTIGFATNYDYDDDDSYNNMAVVDDYYNSNFDITNNNFTIGNNNFTIGNNNFTLGNF
ncbi:hypothetical protein FRACYDRAFT_267502 [Fragilariopsis cylindrus CCMP1102]|uniref:Uncharacterized protein n=1 Tax=Fragilariopsis cylindrus CCMP1102 TaxID=635003 RepID=A0A1E7FZS4_9STRA|nr:hypothetical protein FRACYDRAFT_267502 [Fragilariopsis cylindrus CCMP1102]|eukprot:OEU23323.1 hypothetical protein FRACYDRAFT_267502 [Fragilariopsis cylindrus CCMP1102]